MFLKANLSTLNLDRQREDETKKKVGRKNKHIFKQIFLILSCLIFILNNEVPGGNLFSVSSNPRNSKKSFTLVSSFVFLSTSSLAYSANRINTQGKHRTSQLYQARRTDVFMFTGERQSLVKDRRSIAHKRKEFLRWGKLDKIINQRYITSLGSIILKSKEEDNVEDNTTELNQVEEGEDNIDTNETLVESNDSDNTVEDEERVISLSDAALKHLGELKEKQGATELCLRMGVRSGGCSGMSYVMDVCSGEDITEEDHIEEYADIGVRAVIDPKSLLYLFGLQLDYKDALIGGGFQFYNPNADETCGCGKSFGV